MKLTLYLTTDNLILFLTLIDIMFMYVKGALRFVVIAIGILSEYAKTKYNLVFYILKHYVYT